LEKIFPLWLKELSYLIWSLNCYFLISKL